MVINTIDPFRFVFFCKTIKPFSSIFHHFPILKSFIFFGGWFDPIPRAGQLVRSEVMRTLQGDRRGPCKSGFHQPKTLACHAETWDLTMILYKPHKLRCSRNVGVEATGRCVHIQWWDLRWSVSKDCHITHQKRRSWPTYFWILRMFVVKSCAIKPLSN